MKLTKDNYYSQEANLKYMSNSQYKGFLECEAKAMARLNGEWKDKEQTYFLVGKYVHAWNEGVLDQFKEEHPEIFTKSGTLRSEFKNAEEIIEVIKNDDLLKMSLSGKKEVLFTAEMYGTEWKILIDSYFPDKEWFGDLKVLKGIYDKFWNTEANSWQNVFEYRGYFTQMAVYAEIERLANKRDNYFEPFIAVLTKEEYPDKEIISFLTEGVPLEQFIVQELVMIEHNMPRILAVKSGKEKPNRCERCAYCRKTKVLTGTKPYTYFMV